MYHFSQSLTCVSTLSSPPLLPPSFSALLPPDLDNHCWGCSCGRCLAPRWASTAGVVVAQGGHCWGCERPPPHRTTVDRTELSERNVCITSHSRYRASRPSPPLHSSPLPSLRCSPLISIITAGVVVAAGVWHQGWQALLGLLTLQDRHCWGCETAAAPHTRRPHFTK